MLSLKRCREILGADSPETESDLELLRDQLYGLVRVAVEAIPQKPRKNSPPRPPECLTEALALLPEEERYEVEERAGIMEFEGGLERGAAEQAAFSEFWRAKHCVPEQK